MTVGETGRMTATVRNAANATIPTAPIEWSSSSPDVASVSASGLVTARSAGTTTIRAVSGGRSDDRQVTVRAKEVVVRRDTEATVTSPVKSEADLRSEIQAALRTYVRAIESRDTSLLRRAYPNISSGQLKAWQATFNDAAGPIQVTGSDPEILDRPRDVAGSQVRARAQYTARFSSRQRREVSFPIAFLAALQRDGNTWRITNIQ